MLRSLRELRGPVSGTASGTARLVEPSSFPAQLVAVFRLHHQSWSGPWWTSFRWEHLRSFRLGDPSPSLIAASLAVGLVRHDVPASRPSYGMPVPLRLGPLAPLGLIQGATWARRNCG